jgi:transcriptional regulator with XRE-family HTH domain
MDMRELFGRNLLRIRLEKGLNQEELAARAGLTQHYVSGAEAGKRNPTIVTLLDLAASLGVSHLELLKPVDGKKIRRG